MAAYRVFLFGSTSYCHRSSPKSLFLDRINSASYHEQYRIQDLRHFAALNSVFPFLIYFPHSETKNLVLEQVDRIFIGGDSINRGAMCRRQITGNDFTPSSEEKPEPNDHMENVKQTAV